MSRPSISRYQEVEVLTLSAPRRLVLLYEHLLNTLRHARRFIDLEDHESMAKALCRAQDMIYELVVTLDREAGGALAEQLAALYGWWLKELLAIGITPDGARLDKVIGLVTELHGAWRQAAEQAGAAPGAVPVRG